MDPRALKDREILEFEDRIQQESYILRISGIYRVVESKDRTAESLDHHGVESIDSSSSRVKSTDARDSESALGEFRNHFNLPSISILSRLSRPLSRPGEGTRARKRFLQFLITKQTSSSIKQRLMIPASHVKRSAAI